MKQRETSGLKATKKKKKNERTNSNSSRFVLGWRALRATESARRRELQCCMPGARHAERRWPGQFRRGEEDSGRLRAQGEREKRDKRSLHPTKTETSERGGTSRPFHDALAYGKVENGKQTTATFF